MRYVGTVLLIGLLGAGCGGGTEFGGLSDDDDDGAVGGSGSDDDDGGDDDGSDDDATVDDDGTDDDAADDDDGTDDDATVDDDDGSTGDPCPCSDGFYCDLASDRCVEGCSDNEDCRDGEICDDRECREGCVDAEGCPSGRRCDLETRLCASGCDDMLDCDVGSWCSPEDDRCHDADCSAEDLVLLETEAFNTEFGTCFGGCSEGDTNACFVSCLTTGGLGEPCADCTLEYNVCLGTRCPSCYDAYDDPCFECIGENCAYELFSCYGRGEAE